MSSYSSIKKIFWASICLLVSSISLAATDPIIDNVELNDQGQQLNVVIHFTMPVSISSHYPSTRGKQLDITIQPLATSPDQQESVQQIQSLAYKAKQYSPLRQIEYNPKHSSGTVLSLFFSAQTKFHIQDSADPRMISLLLDKKQTPVLQKTTSTPVKEKLQSLEQPENFKYTINLQSSKTPLSKINPDQYPLLSPYFIYATEINVQGEHWYRLRLGFYKTKHDASSILERARQQFPRAWISRVRPGERQHIQPWLTALANKRNKLAYNEGPVASKKPVSKEISTKSQRLFAQAKKAIIDTHYKDAIRLLTRLLRLPENESSEPAQELIGVAREKNRQIAHAIGEYRLYLKKYPKGEFRYRVKQRLDGLLSAKRGRHKTLRKAKSRFRETPLQVYGSVFQFYRQDVDTTDPSTNITTNASLSTDVSLTMRKRTKEYDIRTQMTGSYQYDIERNDQSQFRVSSMYLDASDRKRTWNARVGRQSQSTGGVLGRFDGLSAGYRFNPRWKINAVTGFPVSISSSNEINVDKVFYGTSLDIGTFDKYWSGSLFFIKQTSDDIDDRTAAGVELRYLNPKATIFTLLDYDIDYGSVNIAQGIANIRLPEKINLNLVADYRNSPVLTTSNALQGQTVSTLGQLLDTYSEDEIKQLAQDRTAIFRSVSATLSRPLNNNFQLSLDVAASHLASTKTSGNVDATPSTGIEYFYGAQLIANNILKKGDTTLMGVRFADTSASQTTTLSLNSRYPFNKQWRVNPRLRVDFQDRQANSKITRYRPSVRLDWRARRNVKFEMETGYEQSNIEDSVGDRTESSFFVNIGYIADF